MAAATDSPQVQEAIALLKKTSTAEGGSLHDRLVKLVAKVGLHSPSRGQVPSKAPNRTAAHPDLSLALGPAREAIRPCRCVGDSSAGEEAERQQRQRQHSCGAHAGRCNSRGAYAQPHASCCRCAISDQENYVFLSLHAAAGAPCSPGSCSSQALRVRLAAVFCRLQHLMLRLLFGVLCQAPDLSYCQYAAFQVLLTTCRSVSLRQLPSLVPGWGCLLKVCALLSVLQEL